MHGAPARLLEERRGHLRQLGGDVILAVEGRFVEDRHEDVFGQHVLDDHLAHIGDLNLWVDGRAAQFQKLIQRRFEARIGIQLLLDDVT